MITAEVVRFNYRRQLIRLDTKRLILAICVHMDKTKSCLRNKNEELLQQRVGFSLGWQGMSRHINSRCSMGDISEPVFFVIYNGSEMNES
ncbi:UDP-N-acetylenolpyruvoylglucosamine reductase [Paenibacillus sp. LBL]|nr:UDP-N-acetylenolpyruvoylglucosamine reductase [Paenibacillus sp. LBL]OMF74510.1 hypothetical protein BK142_16650 [Paenibacillus glucanolyticus]